MGTDIDKATTSCQIEGYGTQDHFADISKMAGWIE